jgi:hypothetical protein
MAGIIVADTIQSDQSYPSSINIASPMVVSNTINMNGGSFTGNVNIDNGTLFVDSVNDRVGIGTSSFFNPNYPVEIRKDTGNSGIILHTAGSGGRVGYLTNTRSGTFDIGHSTTGGGLLSFSTSSSGTETLTERMRIDSAGRVTKPFQPAFKATTVNNTIILPSSGDTEVFSTIFNRVNTNYNHNIGGHYNTSNGRFTAPISGLYFVFANIRWETQNFIQNSYIRVFASVNGGTADNGYRTGLHQINGNNEAWSDYMSMTISGTLNLTAGDYVELRGGLNGGSAVIYGSESGWGMYLLG